MIPLALLQNTDSSMCLQGGETMAEELQLAARNPAWAQQASSALAAITRERVELQRAVVEAEDSIVRSVLPISCRMLPNAMD